MATSLAEQLKRLAAPQTSLLKHSKKKASLLFDPSEAANYDRQAIYEIGLSGFVELKGINQRFAEFEETLFSQTSVSFERSVETKETNDKLDAGIRKFLHLLSPYFLLKSSHKALEWLINRYNIHLYNTDDLIMLAIPYHETRIFARVLQILRLSDETGRWHWLKASQKAGVPLSKSVLLNHCASNPAFLKLLCDTTLGAIKVYGFGASALATLIAFHCTTVIGSFEHSGSISELQITHVMEALIRGYASKSVDFVAASYMITAQLVTKASLSTKVLHRLVSRIITKLAHDELLSNSSLLLVIIYQTQESVLSDIPVRPLLRLAQRHNFARVLGQIAANGNRVIPFLVPVISQALSVIQSQDENAHSMKTLVEELLSEVKLEKGDATVLVRAVIDGYHPTEEDISEESESNRGEVLKWYALLVQRLERAYPTVFDAAVCRTLKGEGISAERARDLKAMLGFELPLDLLDKLRHPKSKVRSHAALALSERCHTFTEKDFAALRDSLGDFLTDESPEVVGSALSFPQNVLVDIMGKRSLQTALIRLLERCVRLSGSGKWKKVIEAAAEILCSLGTETASEEVEVLVALLPHLNEDTFAKKVFNSNFAKRNDFIKRVQKLSNASKNAGVVSAIVACLTKEANIVKPASVLEVAKAMREQNLDDARWYVNRLYISLLLAASVPKKAAPSLGIQLLAENDQLIGDKETVLAGESVDLNAAALTAGLQASCEHSLPVQSCFHLLSTLISRSEIRFSEQSSLWLNLQTDDENTNLVIELYRKILKGCSHADKNVSAAYVAQMKLLFKKYCPTLQKQIAFLFNVSTFHGLSAKPEYLELSLRSLRIAGTFLSATPELGGLKPGQESNWNVVPTVLLALQSHSPNIRRVAQEITETLRKRQADQDVFKPLLVELCNRREEILLDEKQLQLVLYNTLPPNRQKKTKDKKHQTALEILLECAISETTPTYIAAGLLNALERVNSQEILKKLLPLVPRFLKRAAEVGNADRHVSAILRNVLSRLDSETCGCLVEPNSWDAIAAAFKDQKTPVILPGGKITRPVVLVFQQINQSLWEGLPQPSDTYQQKILTLLLEVGSVAECPEVLSAFSSALRHIVLDSATILPTLTKMKTVQATEPETNSRRVRARQSLHTAPSLLILQTDEWRQGLTLLELLQNKKKINNVHLLVPILFDLLKRCLDLEEQAPVEYSKQVLLSCILQCCTKMYRGESAADKRPQKASATNGTATERIINVELVVQCIRASQNPQTHHHALLVLTHLAAIVPDQVLHNIMAIFTFMGSLVLRQDDAYSFQVTSKILETIVPVLVKAGEADDASEATRAKLEETVASVMRVFVDALLDVPEHRRLALYHKLLSTLDASRFLWIFLCLVFESHVAHARSETGDPKRRDLQPEVPKRLEVALQLMNQFSPEVIFTNCVALVQYVRMLPMEKDEKSSRRAPMLPELARYNVPTLFSVQRHTPKLLRHYKYTIVTFLSALLSTMPLVSQVSSMDEEEVQKMEPLYRNFLAVLLTFIQVLHRQVDASKNQQAAKYWSVMLGQTCEILDKLNALLPSNMFITVISGLLKHNIQSLRRKAMELLNARLSPAKNKSFMLTCDSESLLTLIKPLMDIVATIEVKENGHAESDEEMEEIEKSPFRAHPSEEVLLSQQTALLSLKLLARLLAYDHKDKFTPILELVTKLLKKREVPNDNILATLVLCCAELCSALRAHAIVALPTLMPAILEVLSEYSSNLNEAPNLVLLSVVSAVLRVVETLPNFLSQYLKRLLEKICVLLALCTRKVSEEGDSSKFSQITNKLSITGQKISTSITPRVLVPAISDCYKVLLKAKEQVGIGPLMTILSDSFGGLTPPDLRNLLAELTDFFLKALNYRDECSSDKSNAVSESELDNVEGHVIKAWVSLVLKLSETSFKPLYYKIYDWATRLETHKDRVITFYRLSYGASDRLKGLFPTFSGYFLKNAVMLLDHCNITKVGPADETEFNDREEERPEELYFGSNQIAEEKCATLVEYILKTLKNVFLYDSHGFVNKESFENLVRPIIDQLENTVGGIESLKTRAEQVLIPCIAQFAVALDDDIMWKQINYQILLKTKHKNPQIRLLSLEAVCKVVHKLGESFLPLIPETIPFLAELLEDEDENVETACRHAVQDLEQVLGEPLQKYF